MAVKQLTDWAKDALSEIYLWDDVVEKRSKKVNAVLTRDVTRERKLAIAIINCANGQELYDVSKQLCPVGTIIEDYDEAFWTRLYSEKRQLVTVELTKSLLDERNRTSASVLLKILERRDRRHWAEEKKVDVKANDTAPISISISAV